MSKTDIYAQREPIPQTPNDPRSSKHRRRRSSGRSFDHHDRRRRSKNSGGRRLLHLFRKDENEKRLWLGMLIVAIVLLTLIGLWQFWYLDHVARKQTRENATYTPPVQTSVPAPSAAE